jgi:hypothetical protein
MEKPEIQEQQYEITEIYGEGCFTIVVRTPLYVKAKNADDAFEQKRPYLEGEHCRPHWKNLEFRVDNGEIAEYRILKPESMNYKAIDPKRDDIVLDAETFRLCFAAYVYGRGETDREVSYFQNMGWGIRPVADTMYMSRYLL